jgi:hypothetical protein
MDEESRFDRSVVLGVSALVLVLGILDLVLRRHDHLLALQQTFVLAGIALAGLWLVSALVETDRGREVARSSMLGVVGGVAGVGLIGLVVLLLG